MPVPLLASGLDVTGAPNFRHAYGYVLTLLLRLKSATLAWLSSLLGILKMKEPATALFFIVAVSWEDVIARAPILQT